MSHHVLLFQDRFADLVLRSEKLNTIRPERIRKIKAGDTLSLRRWTGRPYCSRQEQLRTAVVVSTSAVRIVASPVNGGDAIISVGGVRLNRQESEDFSVGDGFTGLQDFALWFFRTHGPVFHGRLIRWAPDDLPAADPAPLVTCNTFGVI
jgi:hypothetical protein